MFTVEEILSIDVPLYRDHLKRHLSTSDQTNIIYHPLTSIEFLGEEAWIQKNTAILSKKTSETGWGRCWGIKIESDILAHVNLKGGHLESQLHRCSVGIGIEKNYRGNGLGLKLMKVAIDWAKENNLSWMDLYVHTHNTPALKLYSKLGFAEVATTKDCFRKDGLSIDDTYMILKLF